MMSAELHVASHDLVVIRLLYFDVQQPIVLMLDRDMEEKVTQLYLVSPLETKPMLSNGSCLTGLSLSHGVDDLRVRGGGNGPAIFDSKAVSDVQLQPSQHNCVGARHVCWKLLPSPLLLPIWKMQV